MDVRTYLMMGAPGSGKGTQAKLLAEKLKGKVYSSGGRLREIAASGSYFGKRAGEIMAKGDLLPVWVAQYLFEEALLSLEPVDAIVFEGACRIVEEARRFHEAAMWLERPYVAVYLEAPEEALKARLLIRGEGRADDEASVLTERFENFRNLTMRSIEYFKQEHTLITLNGDQPVEKVHADVLEALKIQ